MGMKILSPEAKGLIRFAWAWMGTGLLIGVFMGMWSFLGPLPVPPFLAATADEIAVASKSPTDVDIDRVGYSTVSRRLLRLGHIAFIALSIILILYAHFIDEANLSPGKKRLAINLVKIGAVGIPTVCLMGSVWLPLKYLFVIPGPSMTAGVFMLAYGLNTGEPAPA